uniref:SFRICE_002732 n=1 Tax=Spodoptera frugiperda TaxID=7108 RepID=A0A2H1V637_SPOFR
MVGSREESVQRIFIVILAVLIASSQCLKVGLPAGEMKRLRPMVIKKFSQISPVYINIRSEDKTLARELLSAIHAKAPIKRSIAMPQPSRKIQRSIFSVPKLPLVPYILPLIPKSPLLPLFPNWLPSPPPSPAPMKPPLSSMPNIFAWDKAEPGVLEKLIRMRQRGDLTTEEYLKFKYLLLKK